MGDERWEQAIASLMRFLDRAPEALDRQRGYRNLAACYLAMERSEDALAALDRASQMGPKDPDLAHSRAVILACAGRTTEAIAEFEHYAHRWPAAAQATNAQDTLQYLKRIQDGEMPSGSYLADHLLEQVGDNIDLGDWHIVERKGRRIIAADPQRPGSRFCAGGYGELAQLFDPCWRAFPHGQGLRPRHP
jgi:tetratricopeptide (TPR) repeat protein